MKDTDRFFQIIECYMKGNSNKRDLEFIESVLKDEKNEQELEWVLNRSWEYDRFDKRAPQFLDNSEEVLETIHERIDQGVMTSNRKRVKRFFDIAMKVAAILVIGFITGWFVQTIDHSQVKYYTSVAPEGSISKVLLPDSSLIILNSGSRVRYSIEGKNGKREVFLNGEGWFEIQKDEDKPFVVHTTHYDVNVVGTEFNVKAYKNDNEVQTTLEHGKIVISATGKYRIPDQELKPGEQFVLNKTNKKVELKKVNTKLFTSWKDNKLIFLDMKLKQLFVLLERKYGVDIQVLDESIMDYRYYGTIRNETILEVLDILTHSLSIEYKITGQKVIITKERKNMK